MESLHYEPFTQKWSTVELHSLANTITNVIYHPGCLLQKVLAVKAPKDIYNLAMKHIFLNQEPKTPWSQNTGPLMLDLQDFHCTKPILLMITDILQE